jgi:hypothetical protein
MRPICVTAAVLATALAGGCRAKIGDPCLRSTDCSLRGDRMCDLSNRVDGAGKRDPNGKGECTVEGCGFDTCPKEAACVKVYGSDFLSVACDPDREDIATACDADDPGCVCNVDGDCAYPPLDDCDANEVCLPEGLCADEITARTSCRRECSDDDDCRAGYECVRTGSRGIYRAPDPKRPNDEGQVKICTPEA